MRIDGINSTGCDRSDFWHEVIMGFADPGGSYAAAHDTTVRPLTASVTLTPGELARASIVKHVSISSKEAVASDCGSCDGTSCKQGFTWSGSVTFRKVKLKIG